MKLTKKTYLLGFIVVVLLLAAVRAIFPEVAQPREISASELPDAIELPDASAIHGSSRPSGFTHLPHRISSVSSYDEAFPDTQAVQLAAAELWGVTPVKNRKDAEARMRELVYIGANPYYHVDPLYSSIPYLVPRAAVLLEDTSSDFSGFFFVISEKSETLMLRRPGEVGLYCLIPISFSFYSFGAPIVRLSAHRNPLPSRRRDCRA